MRWSRSSARSGAAGAGTARTAGLAAALAIFLAGCSPLELEVRHVVDVRLSTDACPPRFGPEAKEQVAGLDPVRHGALLGALDALGDHRARHGC